MNSQQYLQLQFDTLFQHSTHGIWIMDGAGVVMKVNPVPEKD
ncbi:hypothetical protein D1AOALGA4SA_2024 [Olavius algarvensis Delta 1 endosymbiont]|nr:hypothetical protein D1AOALGA4SA_2024 [Olavius algarvensis Delta 1 endosymbiont]